MVVAIRLARFGCTHRPFYRVTVADSRRAPAKKFLEHVGTYDPLPDRMGNKHLRLNIARIKYWIGVGAQPSEVVARLLSRFHLIPTPPSRINIPTNPLLHMVLAGQDVRHLVPKPGENPALALTEPVQHEKTAQKFAQKQLTPQRVEQLKRDAPWKLRAFPLQFVPTSATMQAWQQARIFHNRIPKIPSKPEEAENEEKKEEEKSS